ncbi:MAG: hypothetical protein M1840_008119 [Geoglossum simile]|nr:MAG: hypothetical protein M1840_008119 [Geoglossum simile]
MSSDKDRLYIALYARSSPSTYHWAFLVSQKGNDKAAVRYHAVNKAEVYDGGIKPKWIFEKRELDDLMTQMLLVRVLVAKIQNSSALEGSLRSVPIVQDDTSWTCRIWVRDALQKLADDGVLGTNAGTAWARIEKECYDYVTRKKAEGRFDVIKASEPPPTFDLICGKETSP